MDHYFFFKQGMPIAVFKTKTKDEAKNLFSRLYRQTWVESLADGVTVIKENDVPACRWDEIHDKYVAEKLEAERGTWRASESQRIFKLPIKPIEQGSTLLESAKYMR